MTDRNDLAIEIAHPGASGRDLESGHCADCRRAVRVADRLIEQGFRRTVTPEQIEAAIAVGWGEYRYPRPALDEPTDRFIRGIKAALGEVGLSVDGAE